MLCKYVSKPLVLIVVIPRRTAVGSANLPITPMRLVVRNYNDPHGDDFFNSKLRTAPPLTLTLTEDRCGTRQSLFLGAMLTNKTPEAGFIRLVMRYLSPRRSHLQYSFHSFSHRDNPPDNDCYASPRATGASYLPSCSLINSQRLLEILQPASHPFPSAACVRRTFRRTYGTARHDNQPSGKTRADVKGSTIVPAVSRDCLPFSFGIESASGIFIPIIHRGSKIPSEGLEVFTPAEDHRVSDDIHIYQGNRVLARRNTLLGTFHFLHHRPCLRYRTTIQMIFRLNEQLSLHVSASHVGSESPIQTASFRTVPDIDDRMDGNQDREEVAYLRAKDAAEESLCQVRTAFQQIQISADQVPPVKAAIVSLEAILVAKECPSYLDLQVRLATLQNAAMEYFDKHHHKSPKSSLLTDSWSPLF
jgi:Hsp70 protein